MADQICLQHIRNGLARLNSMTGTTAADAYTLERVDSGYRIEREEPTGGHSHISPSLPKAQLYTWLWAFIDGHHEGMKTAKRAQSAAGLLAMRDAAD